MKIDAERLTMAAVGEQPLSDEDKTLLADIYARLDIFEQGCRQYHEAARECREILRLRDPKQDPPGAREKTLQLQTLKSVFNNSVADQMENMPEPRLLPETPDMQEAADDMQDALRYVIYDVNNYEMVHRRRAEDLYGPGTAVTQVVWDPEASYGKGDVALIRWPIEAFLWDPKAEDIQEARALIKVSWHPLSWYWEHYPEKAPYVQGEDGAHNGVGLPETQRERDMGDEPLAMLLEYWWREYDAKKAKYTINVAYCAGGALLDKQENVFMHGMYPFVVDVHSTIEGQPVGEGMVTELVPMMRYINKYARYIDTNLRMSSKARMLTRKNSGIDKKALADWSQDIIEGDSVVQGEDWGWLQHAPFPGGAMQQMVQFQSDLKTDSGNSDFTRGQTANGVISGKAIAALQESGSKIAHLRTDTLHNGFKQIVTQALWLMAEFYENKRMVLITGRDGRIRQFEMDRKKYFGHRGKGAMAAPPYMVQVEVNQKNPVRIEAQNQMFMEAYTMAAQAQQYFPLSALFQLLNVEGKDRLLPVIRENEQTQNRISQLEQQNQQMMEQLAKMQAENDNLREGTNRLTEALASGGNFQPQEAGAPPIKAAEAGGGPMSNASLINDARDNLMSLPLGM